MKHKFNWLSLLSLLACLAILAPLTGITEYWGFLGFLAYCKYFFVIPDELFWQNVHWAATPSFFFNVFFTMLCIALKGLGMPEAAVSGSILSFALSMILFSLLLAYREWKELKGE